MAETFRGAIHTATRNITRVITPDDAALKSIPELRQKVYLVIKNQHFIEYFRLLQTSSEYEMHLSAKYTIYTKDRLLRKRNVESVAIGFVLCLIQSIRKKF